MSGNQQPSGYVVVCQYFEEPHGVRRARRAGDGENEWKPIGHGGSGLENASDVPEGVVGRGEKGEERCGAPLAYGAPARTSPLSLLPLFSYDPIHERPEKHDDTDNPVGSEKCGIEPG